jgi:hypothetical protein
MDQRTGKVKALGVVGETSEGGERCRPRVRHAREHENEHVHDDVLDDAHENDYMDTLPQARS